MQLKKAFTLLEMLIVIGIIAILVSLGFASYSTVQKKARDAKRQGDLKAAQQIMEQCYSVNGFKYPTGAGQLSVSGGSITGTCPAPNNSLTFTITDPLNSGTHVYSISSSSTSDYTLTTTGNLETSAIPFTVYNQQ